LNDQNLTPLFSRQKFLRYGALGIALAMMGNSCHENEKSLPLHIGINDWVGYQIIRYAQQSQLLKKRQVALDLIYFSNLQDATRAMLNGALDATFTTLWDLMQPSPYHERVKPMILWITDISHGSDGIVARPPVQSLADLKGKKVGVKFGTINQLILLEAIALNHLSAQDLIWINLVDDVAVDHITQGAIDATVIWQPRLGEVAHRIGGKIIYTTAQTRSLVIDLIATRQSLFAEKQDRFRRLFWVWLDIINVLEKSPDTLFSVLGQTLQRSPQSMATDYQGLTPGNQRLNREMLGSPAAIASAIEKITELMNTSYYNHKKLYTNLGYDPHFINSSLDLWTPLP
jgi:NitT/TauT family transport system substrate-binding protein